MTPSLRPTASSPPIAAIEDLKRLGLWDADAESDALIVPGDLRAAVADQLSADTFFSAAAPSYRRNVLRWIGNAKQEATRQKRVGLTVSLSAKREKVPQL